MSLGASEDVSWQCKDRSRTNSFRKQLKPLRVSLCGSFLSAMFPFLVIFLRSLERNKMQISSVERKGLAVEKAEHRSSWVFSKVELETYATAAHGLSTYLQPEVGKNLIASATSGIPQFTYQGTRLSTTRNRRMVSWVCGMSTIQAGIRAQATKVGIPRYDQVKPYFLGFR